jgi:hypothetical protein
MRRLPLSTRHHIEVGARVGSGRPPSVLPPPNPNLLVPLSSNLVCVCVRKKHSHRAGNSHLHPLRRPAEQASYSLFIIFSLFSLGKVGRPSPSPPLRVESVSLGEGGAVRRCVACHAHHALRGRRRRGGKGCVLVYCARFLPERGGGPSASPRLLLPPTRGSPRAVHEDAVLLMRPCGNRRGKNDKYVRLVVVVVVEGW